MPLDVQVALGKVSRLAASPTKIREAMDEVRHLLRSLSAAQLEVAAAEIRDAIEASFLPAKRRMLVAELEEAIRRSAAESGAARARTVRRRSADELSLHREVSSTLDGLAADHIFEWSTSYRTAVAALYREARGAASESRVGIPVARVLNGEFARHSTDIFERGYRYSISKPGLSRDDVLAKSLGGLHSFMDLPIEVFTADITQSRSQTEARAMWAACSGMLAGILEGFGCADFGGVSGWNVLSRRPGRWFGTLGFMRPTELGRIVSQLPASRVKESLACLLEPTAAAAYQLLTDNEVGMIFLPASSSFNPLVGSIEIGYQLYDGAGGNAYAVATVYLESDLVTPARLRSAISGGATLVVASLAEETWAALQSDDLLRETVVAPVPGAALNLPAMQAKVSALLGSAATESLGRETTGMFLTHNWAHEFPLENLTVSQHFKVSRSSVASLMRSFENRNGIHLWCSPRRSGKSTACRDLGGSANSVFIYQTFSGAEQDESMKVLYASMERLLSSAERMPADFLRDTVEAIAPVTMGGTADERHILVVDEYETLFGMLNGQLCAHPDSKYTQVKPMLDQLVAFSQNNLLILVGMWPDAHYMMMEQNHLSMHVEQDGFPLFFHQSGSTTSEFAELVRRAVSRLEFDAEFCDALYAETAGHPFLTVLLLRHMLDWLIQERFRPGLTPLGRDLFATFAADKLGSRSIALNPHYASYMQVVSGALSVQGLKHTPWVYAVHRIMQAVARKFGPSGACGLDDYESLWDSLELDSTGLDRFEVLRSASLSNFLRLQDDQLSVAIPLLARIADGCRC